MKCHLCGFVGSDESHTNVIMNHLHDVHQIKRCDGTFEAYIYKHFDQPKCSCGQCVNLTSLHCRKPEFKLFSDDCPNAQKFRNVSCPEFYLFRGATISETIACITARQRTIADKSVTDDHLHKLRIINSGNNNPSSIESIKRRTGEHESLIRSKLSVATSGLNNGFAGKKHSQKTLEHLAKVRSKQSKRISSPELIVWGMLHALGISFDYQVPIGKYVADFQIGDVFLEVYGDYWHGPKMKPSNKLRDAEKEKFILKSGYRIVIIKESILMTNPQNIISKLCELKK